MELKKKLLAFTKILTPLAISLCIETAQMLRFYARFPVPKLPFEQNPHAPPNFSVAVRTVPVAAFLISVPSALTIFIGTAIWLPATLIAILAIAVMIMITGGLHEDGLADTADGIGGGSSAEKRLSIMRDSQIGTYGVLALIIVLSLKVFSLTTLMDHQGRSGAVLSLMTAAIISRVMALAPQFYLPPARNDGRAVDVGKPQLMPVIVASILAVVFCFTVLSGFGKLRLLVAFGFAILATIIICKWARTKLGGYTGDVIGATQQISEVTFLIMLNASFHN